MTYPVELPTPGQLYTSANRYTNVLHPAIQELDEHTTKGTRYDLKRMGLKGDGTAENMTTLDTILNEVAADPGGVGVLPRGDYVLADVETASSFPRQLLIPNNGIVLEGEGIGATRLRSTHAGGTARMIAALGHLKAGAFSAWASNEYYDAARYSIASTLAEGATFIPFTTPSQASNFAPGDICFIATGQTTAASADHEPNAELNIVRAINTSAGGGVHVEFPLSDSYAQEQYNSGTTGISSVGGASGNPAPFYIANVTGRTIRNIAIRDMTIDASTALQAFSLWQVWGGLFERVHFRFGSNGVGSANTRFATFRDCTFEHIPASAPSTQWYLLAPSTGCADWRIDTCHGWSRTAAFWHFHEGVKNSHLRGCSNYAYDLSNVNWSLLSVRSRAKGLLFEDNDFRARVATTANLIFIDDLSDDGGRFGRNRIRANAGNAVRIDAGGWIVAPQDTTLPVGLRSAQRAKGTTSETLIYTSWVKFDRKTVELGPLPLYGTVRHIEYNVTTAFDASATLSVGYDGNTAIYAAATAVTATGIVTPTGGAKYKTDEEAAARTIKAYVTGSPTVGEAKVTVEVLVGARRT